jgi:hypothetical protein
MSIIAAAVGVGSRAVGLIGTGKVKAIFKKGGLKNAVQNFKDKRAANAADDPDLRTGAPSATVTYQNGELSANVSTDTQNPNRIYFIVGFIIAGVLAVGGIIWAFRSKK